jgi:hypothetical protein
MKLVLSRVTRAANFVGWNFKVTCGGALVVRGFTNILELNRAFNRVEERAVEAIKSNQHNDRFDEIFHRFVELPEFDRCGVAAYVMGMMKSRMTDDDLKAFNDQVEEMEEARAEFDKETMKKADAEIKGSDYHDALKKNFPVNDRDIHALAAAEESDLTKDIPTEDLPDFKGISAAEVFDDSKFENNKADEEVDASDCCKREDPKCVQPPLRSSVQSSPDDPYYVCNYCGDKCEIITIKRSELED